MPHRIPNESRQGDVANNVISSPVGCQGSYGAAGIGGGRVMAQSAFVAQLFGERLRRRRLHLAREQARSIHRAYGSEEVKEKDGTRIDVSI